jgi:regulator of sigma E protease
MGIIIFICVIAVLVIVHEWGHFIAARMLGVRVDQFAVGFGKTLFAKTHKGTEFKICAIPLGGYVKMAGDEREKCQGKIDEFYAHPVGHRAVIVFMGPLINLVFAYLCFFALFLTGYPIKPAIIGEIVQGSPAQTAGLHVGDKVLSIDQKSIENWFELQNIVASGEGKTINLQIQRGNDGLALSVTPRKEVIAYEEDKESKEHEVWMIGVVAADSPRYGVIQSASRAGQEIKRFTVLTFKGLYEVLTGTIPAKEALAGPIGIFGVVTGAAQAGLSHLILITAIISLSLAIFNLFPIPILDGGHLFFQIIEKIRNKPLPLSVEEGFNKFGFALLMCLLVFVMYNDMDRLGWLDPLRGFVKQWRH